MYWRRSLIVTVILVALGFALNSLVFSILVTWLYSTAGISADQLAQVSTIYGVVISGLLHFIVLWVAFRYYAAPTEKAKRKGVLRAEDVINMLTEEEVAALRDHLLPPSQRGETSKVAG